MTITHKERLRTELQRVREQGFAVAVAVAVDELEVGLTATISQRSPVGSARPCPRSRRAGPRAKCCWCT